MMFVFIPTLCDRGPSVGGEPHDTDPIWEVRSIPGNLIGVGKTPQEAVQKLIGLIEWTKREEPSFERWYRESWAYADSGDDKVFGQFVTERYQTLKKPKQIVVGQVEYGVAAFAN